jgi:hypothetical protein
LPGLVLQQLQLDVTRYAWSIWEREAAAAAASQSPTFANAMGVCRNKRSKNHSSRDSSSSSSSSSSLKQNSCKQQAHRNKNHQNTVAADLMKIIFC